MAAARMRSDGALRQGVAGSGPEWSTGRFGDGAEAPCEALEPRVRCLWAPEGAWRPLSGLCAGRRRRDRAEDQDRRAGCGRRCASRRRAPLGRRTGNLAPRPMGRCNLGNVWVIENVNRSGPHGAPRGNKGR